MLKQRKGRKELPVSVEVKEELSLGDLTRAAGVEKGSRPRALQKLKDSHHRLAQLLTEGYSDWECSVITGYAPARISILKGDPAFQELVQFYRERSRAIEVDLVSRLKLIAADSVQEIADRLESDPESFTVKELRELAKMALDRSGHGPTQKIEKTERNITAEKVIEINEKVRREAEEKVRIKDINRRSQDSGGFDGGQVIDLTVEKETTVDRRSEEGNILREEDGETD